MTIYVYQTFELKQDKFQDAVENLKQIQKFRNEHYDHKVKILTPVSGKAFSYVLLSTYDGLAEMELQDKKMFDDEEYLKLVGDFFLQNIEQGSLHTQIFRTLSSDSES